MIQKFIQKQKGAISIFLAIVLLPMMAIASVYVDASRVKLAKSIMSSAGNLTANTALTHYDNVLKEMYGLFAISQSEEDLTANLEDYYTKCLLSQGLTAEDTNTYVGKIMNQLGLVKDSGKVSDLLRIEVQDEGKSIVSFDEKTSLANPMLLKKQIVEFMKFRFAANVGMDFLNSLASFKGLKEQDTLIKDRKNYYEKQEEVMDNCKEAWRHIGNYNALDCASQKYYEDLMKDLELYIKDYDYMTKNIMMDYYNSGLPDGEDYFSDKRNIKIEKDGDAYVVSVKKHSYETVLTAIDWKKWSIDLDTTGTIAARTKKAATITKLPDRTGLEEACNTLKTGNQNFHDLTRDETGPYNSIMVNYPSNGYDIQRVIQFNRPKDGKSLIDAIKNYYTGYNVLMNGLDVIDTFLTNAPTATDVSGEIIRLQGLIDANDITIASLQAEETEDDDDDDDDDEDEEEDDDDEPVDNSAEILRLQNENNGYQSQIDDLNEYGPTVESRRTAFTNMKTEQHEWYSAQKTYGQITSNGVKYEQDMKLCKEVYDRLSAIIIETNKNHYKDPEQTKTNKEWVSGEEVGTRATKISNRMKAAYTLFETASTELGYSSSYLQEIYDSITSGDLYNAKNNWNASANNSKITDTSLAEQNKQEITITDDFISADEVLKLKTRVDQTKHTVDNAKTQLEQYTYYDSPIKDISKLKEFYDLLKTNSGIDVEKISLLKSELDTMCKTIYQNFKYPTDKLNVTFASENKSTETEEQWNASSHPEFESSKAECSFYKYLRKNFKEVCEQEAKTGDPQSLDDEDEDMVDKSEDKLQEVESDGKEKSDSDDSEKETTHTINDGLSGELPSAYWKSTLKPAIQAGNESAKNGTIEEGEVAGEDGILEQIGTFVEKLGALAGEALVDFRDNIFISDYCLSMFTYQTYEKEKLYDIKGEAEAQASLSELLEQLYKALDGSNSMYKPGEDGKYVISNNKETQATIDEYIKTAKSLTNVPLSPNNNYLYLNEVEYILFGENGTAKTYGSIFAIRAIFNTIYAFTNSEIREGAYSIATAVFGCPPLTFLIPVAQSALVIAIALAESAIDMMMLQAGMKVPIFKNEKTWVLKFSSLMADLMDAAIDTTKKVVTEKIKNGVKDIIDDGISKIGAFIDKTDEEIDSLIEQGSSEIKELADDVGNTINAQIDKYVDIAVNQMVQLAQNAISMCDDEEKIKGMTLSEYIKSEMEEWKNGQLAGMASDSLQYMAIDEGVNVILNTMFDGKPCIDRLLDILMQKGNFDPSAYRDKTIDDAAKQAIESGMGDLAKTIQEQVKKLRDSIAEKVKTAENKVKGYVDSAKQKVNDAIAGKGEALKKTLNDTIDNALGTTNSKAGETNIKISQDGSTLGSIFSFQYSDYLRLFLLLGLTFGQESILMRTADIIETNMRYKKGSMSEASDAFKMNKAYVYVTIDATAKVRPLLLNLGFVKKRTKDANFDKKEDWYTIHYKDVIGY